MYSQRSRFSRDINASMLLQCQYEVMVWDDAIPPLYCVDMFVFWLGGEGMEVYLIIYTSLLDVTTILICNDMYNRARGFIFIMKLFPFYTT